MKPGVVLDTGPLVAFLDRRDNFHDWAKTQLALVQPPLLTCEPVLTEACFLLRDKPDGSQAVLELLRRGVLEIGIGVRTEAQALMKLLKKYANVPASLADVCLIRITELRSGSVLMTLDRDFEIYRRQGRQVIPLLTPNDA